MDIKDRFSDALADRPWRFSDDWMSCEVTPTSLRPSVADITQVWNGFLRPPSPEARLDTSSTRRNWLGILPRLDRRQKIGTTRQH